MKGKLEKFLDPVQYREKKVKNFLKEIRLKNLYFESFPDPSHMSKKDCNRYIYGRKNKEFRGVKNIATELEEVLNKELEKPENIRKKEKGKNASYKYLSEIKDACSGIPNTIGGNALLTLDPKPGIEACKKLQKAFERASKFSDTFKISFLSEKNVKQYMAQQSNILKKSIENMNKVISKNAGTKEPQKPVKKALSEMTIEEFLETTEKDRKKKAQNFLQAIKENDVYFASFPSTSGLNYVHCNMYLYSDKLELSNNRFIKGAPVVIKSLKKVLESELKKEEFKNDSGYKYLLGIKNACSRFLTIYEKWKNKPLGAQPSSPGIKAFAGVQQAFTATYRFSNRDLPSKAFNRSSDKNESSFLANNEVIKYLGDQVKILESSTKNMGKIPK